MRRIGIGMIGAGAELDRYLETGLLRRARRERAVHVGAGGVPRLGGGRCGQALHPFGLRRSGRGVLNATSRAFGSSEVRVFGRT